MDQENWNEIGHAPPKFLPSIFSGGKPIIACFMIMSCPGESSGEIKRYHPIAMRLYKI
jgi:hypothetical protein